MMVLPENTFAGLGISGRGNPFVFRSEMFLFFVVVVDVGVTIFAGAQGANISLDSPYFWKSQ